LGDYHLVAQIKGEIEMLKKLRAEVAASRALTKYFPFDKTKF